jgi:hypothetical protein
MTDTGLLFLVAQTLAKREQSTRSNKNQYDMW